MGIDRPEIVRLREPETARLVRKTELKNTESEEKSEVTDPRDETG